MTLGEELNARWRLALDRVFSALDAFAPRGDVLELAYGTGEWTIRLAEVADSVVGVDAARRCAPSLWRSCRMPAEHCRAPTRTRRRAGPDAHLVQLQHLRRARRRLVTARLSQPSGGRLRVARTHVRINLRLTFAGSGAGKRSLTSCMLASRLSAGLSPALSGRCSGPMAAPYHPPAPPNLRSAPGFNPTAASIRRNSLSVISASFSGCTASSAACRPWQASSSTTSSTSSDRFSG